MKGFKLKTCIATIISATIILAGQCYAEESTISISKIDINNRMATVTALYNGEEGEGITMTAIKNDDSLMGYDKYYAVLQYVAETRGEVVFDFIIPDRKEGISSTGEYTICVKAGVDNMASETFSYIITEELEALVDQIKNADSEISGTDEVTLKASAVTKLLPFFVDTYDTELIALGIDYDSFKIKPEAIKSDTMYYLHKSNLTTANASTIGESFSRAFGVSMYNHGEKTQGLKYYNPAYTDNDVMEMLSIMSDSYESVEAFANACDIAYSLIAINNANVDNLLSRLESYPATTELTTAISRIKALESAKEVKAYEYFVSEINKTPVKNVAELVRILGNAYESATKTQESGWVPSASGGMQPSYAVSSKIEKEEIVESVDSVHLEFLDVNTSHWAHNCIKWLFDKGIVNGDGYGKFFPENAVTREEFIKMIVLAGGISGDAEMNFADVESGAWYEEYIGVAVSTGITNGISEDNFGVGENITREDMITMSARLLNVINKELNTVRDYAEFTDSADISDYAKEAVKTMYCSGIVNGFKEGVFAPKAQATRAEVAKIIYEMFKEVK